MKKSHYVLSGIIMLLSMCLFGCGTTNTFVTYDGARLPQDRVANLEFSQNYLLKASDAGRVDVIAVDKKITDNTNDSKWNSDLGPANIELLPGSHSLHIEYFFPAVAGGKISSPSKTIATGEVTLTAEVGQKYVLEVNRQRTEKSGILYCTIKDGAGNVVYRTNPFPGVSIADRNLFFIPGNVVYRTNPFPFSLSEIPNDKAVVCFYREQKMTAGASPFAIMEDGNVLRSLANNDVYFHVTTPGSHSYSVELTYVDINGNKLGANNVDLNLAPGSVSYILLRPNTNLITLEIFPTSVKEEEFSTWFWL